MDDGFFALNAYSLTHAAIILLLRLADMTVDVFRISAVARGRRAHAAGFGVLEAAIFVTTMTQVLLPPVQLAQILAYALGYGTGVYFGMRLADRYLSGNVEMRVLSRDRGDELDDELRTAGYAVTLIRAEGRDGPIPMLLCLVERHQVADFVGIVQRLDPQAFIVSDPVGPVIGGRVQRFKTPWGMRM